MGRPRKPTALKIANGSAKRNAARINRGEPRPPTNGRRNPFAVRSAAGKVWREMVDDAKSMKVLTDADYAAVRLYAESWQDFIDAKSDIESNGRTIESPRGGLHRNPAIETKQTAWRNCLRIPTKFGMTPSSRTSVSALAGDADASPLARFATRA